MATIWTLTTLSKQLRGEIDADPDASGGAVPARLINLVKSAYRSLWEGYPWLFRKRRATITVASAGTTVALPSDFEQFDHRHFEESEGKGLLTITLDTEVFENHRERYDESGDVPELAILEPATDLSEGFSWILQVSPPADAARTFAIIYYCLAPALTDTGDPVWPQPFHEAWELVARSKVYYDYRPANRDPDQVWRHAMGVIDRLTRTNDRPTRTGVQRIRDTVGDVRALTSQAFVRGGAPAVWRGG